MVNKFSSYYLAITIWLVLHIDPSHRVHDIFLSLPWVTDWQRDLGQQLQSPLPPVARLYSKLTTKLALD
jgi:hypothetical protein